MNILVDTNLGAMVTQTIAQLFQGAAFGGAANEGVYFSYSWPTQVLQESIYQNPWSPTNPAGSMATTENLSNLTDAIPLLGPHYNPSGNTVPDIYEMILNGYTVPGNKAMARRAMLADAAPLARKKTAVALADWQLGAQGLLVLPEVEVPTMPKPVALTAPTDAYLQQLAAEQQTANNQARENLERLQRGLPAAPPPAPLPAARFANGPARTSGDCFASLAANRGEAASTDTLNAAFRKANAVFLGTQLASLLNPTLTFHATGIYPADFADPAAAAAWPTFRMSYQLVQPVVQTVTVTFQFCRVDIVRAWMLPYIFNLRGWSVQGQEPGWLSTGSTTANGGVFPLLPVSLIVGRDLVVTSQTGDVHYASPGLQILARVSKVLPAMPA